MYGTGFSVATAAWEERVVVMGSTLAGRSRQPLGSAAVQILHLGPGQPRHVAFDVVADLGLDVGEVEVAGGELPEQSLIELRRAPARDRSQAVDLIDRL